MKVYDRSIRPIPRQSIMGWMSLGIIEDLGIYYVLQMEPQGSDPPFIGVVRFTKMKRADDILDGDTEGRISSEIREAVLEFAVQREVLTNKRIEIAIRKAAAMSLKPTPPDFHHQYSCLMYKEKLYQWDAQGRKGMAPPQMVSTYDCWKCPKNFREPCIFKLTTEYEEDTKTDRYIGDIETDPTTKV